MIRRLLFPLVGILLIAGVVWLGLQSADDNGYIPAFGIASALAAPLGLAAIAQAFRARDADVLRRLSRVPELQELIEKAASTEEKIRLLEQERNQLAEVIEREAARRALADRHQRLIEDGRRVVEELEIVDTAANGLNADVDEPGAVAVIRALEERLHAERDGYVTIRVLGRPFAFKPNSQRYPFVGPLPVMLAEAVLRLVAAAQRRRGRT